jgi:ketosteroid isomerase-like protein
MTITKQQVIDLESRLIEAISANDSTWLEQHLHEDLLFLGPGGQIITRQVDLDSHRKHEMVVAHLIPTFEEIRIMGDTVTVVVVYDTRGTMLGQPIEGNIRYVRVWKMIDDRLQVIAGSCHMLS